MVAVHLGLDSRRLTEWPLPFFFFWLASFFLYIVPFFLIRSVSIGIQIFILDTRGAADKRRWILIVGRKSRCNNTTHQLHLQMLPKIYTMIVKSDWTISPPRMSHFLCLVYFGLRCQLPTYDSLQYFAQLSTSKYSPLNILVTYVSSKWNVSRCHDLIREH